MSILRWSPVVMAALTVATGMNGLDAAGAELAQLGLRSDPQHGSPRLDGIAPSQPSSLLGEPVAGAMVRPHESHLIANSSPSDQPRTLVQADPSRPSPEPTSAPAADPNRPSPEPTSAPATDPSRPSPEPTSPPAADSEAPPSQEKVPASPTTAQPPTGTSPLQATPTEPTPATPPSTEPSTPEQPSPATPPEPRVLVAEVLVQGAEGELQDEVYRVIRTRPGQVTTRSQLQEDINAVFATGFFAKVEATPTDTPLGVRITFAVEPNPVLQSVNIEGNTILSQEEIGTIFQPQYGSVLNLRDLQRGTQALLKLYQDQGYVLAQVVGVPNIAPDGQVTLTLAEGQVASVQVAFINKEGEGTDAEGKPIQGRTRSFIVTREMQTQPGKVFNRTIAEGDLQRIFGLGIFDDVKLDLQPAQDPREVNVVIQVAEKRGGSIALGGGISSASGLFGTVSLQEQNLGGNDQNIGVEFQIGQRELLFDVSFTDPWIAGDPYRTSYTVNGFRRRNISLVFEGPDTVDVINTDGNSTDNPRTVRTGGALNFTRPLSRNVFTTAPWTASLGLTYQRILIQDDDNDLVSPNAVQINEQGQIVGFGSNLSWSGESKDDLLTFQFGVQNDRRNNVQRPTSGSLFRFGTEQSVPVGLGNILFNRLRSSYSFYIPTRLLKFAPECRNQPKQPPGLPKPAKPPQECFQTFAFNLQAGSVVGDLPPYDAFTLGGANSIRGWEEGYVASGKSFAQATIEYRFPLFSVVSGALFIDAGSDLGTGQSVKGNPGGVRGKPGSGLGYGVGVRIQSPLGPLRIDWGFNNEGGNQINFGIGERF